MNRKVTNTDEAFITFGKKFKNAKNTFNLSLNGNLNEAANNLYKTMRKIKKNRFSSISICKIPNRGIGNAINERLKKASYKWKK
jgi:L-threonylcarbamoyladenylate synthase